MQYNAHMSKMKTRDDMLHIDAPSLDDIDVISLYSQITYICEAIERS